MRPDSALRGIGRPVVGPTGRGRAGGVIENPMAHAFTKAMAKLSRGDNLLSGHISSTEAGPSGVHIEALPEALPKTAAEALTAMQSRLAAESPSHMPRELEAFPFKAPDTKVVN